jgi:acetyl esterase/lipase
LAECLKSGISVAAIHYRFATTHPFPASQHDGARAIQFLRSQAEEWNLDPQRFAAYGGSAGAGMSMWLAFHDELADPQSDDPVLRLSSRVAAVGSFGGQSSYDPHVIEDWIGGRANEHPSVFIVYNVRTLEELSNPQLQPLYDEVSAIKHVTADDPPIYLFYNEPDRPLPEDARPGVGIRHPNFAHKLIEELKRHDIPYLYRHASEFRGDPHLDMLEFFKKQFAKEEAKP